MNGRSKKEEMKKSSSWVSYKKRRLKNIDSKRNKNRSGNLISRCFERKEKKKKTNKNKQEREYIHPIQKFLLFPLISSQRGRAESPDETVEIVKFILVINEIDVAHCVLILKYCRWISPYRDVLRVNCLRSISRFTTYDTRTIADIYERTVVSVTLDMPVA